MLPHSIDDVVKKLRTLPPQRIAEVADFVDFLRQRSQPADTGKRPSLDFPVINVGQWPDDLSMRREDLYNNDGR
ncbi:MAG: hypothetical protein V3T17_02145 [Pseudomonadales bacterium]